MTMQEAIRIRKRTVFFALFMVAGLFIATVLIARPHVVYAHQGLPVAIRTVSPPCTDIVSNGCSMSCKQLWTKSLDYAEMADSSWRPGDQDYYDELSNNYFDQWVENGCYT
jgi:hypothetical protein